MTAEDLVKKHLNADISSPQFWRDSLGIVAEKVGRVESSLAAVQS